MMNTVRDQIATVINRKSQTVLDISLNWCNLSGIVGHSALQIVDCREFLLDRISHKDAATSLVCWPTAIDSFPFLVMLCIKVFLGCALSENNSSTKIYVCSSISWARLGNRITILLYLFNKIIIVWP